MLDHHFECYSLDFTLDSSCRGIGRKDLSLKFKEQYSTPFSLVAHGKSE